MIIFGAGPIGIMLGMLAKKLYSIDQVDFVELSEYRRSFLNSIGVSDNIYKPNEIEEKINEFEGSYQYVVTACSAIHTHILGISFYQMEVQLISSEDYQNHLRLSPL